MLNVFIVLNYCLNFGGNPLEGPLSEFWCETHVLQLTIKLHARCHGKEAGHLNKLCLACGLKCIAYRLSQLTINFILEEGANLRYRIWNRLHHSLDKIRNRLLFDITGHDLKGWATVTLWSVILHSLKKLGWKWKSVKILVNLTYLSLSIPRKSLYLLALW